MNVRIYYLPLRLIQLKVLELVLGTLLQSDFSTERDVGYPPAVHVLRSNGKDSVRFLDQCGISRNADGKVNEETAAVTDHGPETSPEIEVICPQCASRGLSKGLKFSKTLDSVPEIKGGIVIEIGVRRIVGIDTEMQVGRIVPVRGLHIPGVKAEISEIEINIGPFQIRPSPDACTGIHIVALPGLPRLAEGVRIVRDSVVIAYE